MHICDNGANPVWLCIDQWTPRKVGEVSQGLTLNLEMTVCFKSFLNGLSHIVNIYNLFPQYVIMVMYRHRENIYKRDQWMCWPKWCRYRHQNHVLCHISAKKSSHNDFRKFAFNDFFFFWRYLSCCPFCRKTTIIWFVRIPDLNSSYIFSMRTTIEPFVLQNTNKTL